MLSYGSDGLCVFLQKLGIGPCTGCGCRPCQTIGSQCLPMTSEQMAEWREKLQAQQAASSPVAGASCVVPIPCRQSQSLLIRSAAIAPRSPPAIGHPPGAVALRGEAIGATVSPTIRIVDEYAHTGFTSARGECKTWQLRSHPIDKGPHYYRQGDHLYPFYGQLYGQPTGEMLRSG